jgi:hypothetical protein
MRYTDHIGLWEHELRDWLPEELFDVHVHTGPPDVVGPVSPQRRREALSTFMSFPLEELQDAHRCLYGGKKIAGYAAFPFPQREVDLAGANRYMIDAMKRDPRLHALLLSEPVDTGPAIAAYEAALAEGVRFEGVKPYADRLGRSNFDVRMAEFLPDALFEFMAEHNLIMMLHTSGVGVGDPEVRRFLRHAAARYPSVRIVLAHLGRYVEPRQFLDFLDSGTMRDCPSLYLEMSSATRAELYRRILEEGLWQRLVFGSDLPFGLITGVEKWSERYGAIFLSRDTYSWSDPKMNAEFAAQRKTLTYNTYHVIEAFRQALESLGLNAEEKARIKRRVFCQTAAGLLGGAT